MISFNPTISSYSTGITSLLFFISSAVIFTSWKKTKDHLLKYFFFFLLFFGCQQLFFSLGTGSLSLNPIVNSWLWTIAHLFMFLGLSFFIRFPFAVQLPKLEKTAFNLAILYSIMGSLYFLLTAQQPAVNSKLLSNNVFLFTVPKIHTIIIVIFTSLTLVSSVAIFIYNAIKTEDKFIKQRSIIIALALLIFLIGGPVHNLVHTPLLTTIADGMIVISMVIMMVGMYIRKIVRNQ
jgi:hypothetical protein|tara:strand:+ start:7296 stop:8000 length:705 start_codon:yes stop_codon:yes gene_type:complete